MTQTISSHRRLTTTLYFDLGVTADVRLLHWLDGMGDGPRRQDKLKRAARKGVLDEPTGAWQGPGSASLAETRTYVVLLDEADKEDRAVLTWYDGIGLPAMRFERFRQAVRRGLMGLMDPTTGS